MRSDYRTEQKRVKDYIKKIDKEKAELDHYIKKAPRITWVDNVFYYLQKVIPAVGILILIYMFYITLEMLINNPPIIKINFVVKE